MIGYYSEQATKMYGSSIYNTPDNKEVEVTGVFNNKKEANKMYKWVDKKYVGPVVEFIRKVTPDANIDHYPHFLSDSLRCLCNDIPVR